MMTKRNALLAAGVAVLAVVAGSRAASAADVNWEPNSYGNVPWDAVVGGRDTDGSMLYFCRTYYGAAVGSSGYQPGKVNQNLTSCRVGYGGQEIGSAGYDVLVPHWESVANGDVPGVDVPGRSFRAGTDTDGAPLYHCRGFYKGGRHPGKLKRGAGCYIPYGGQEILLKIYDVLQDDLPMSLDHGDIFSSITGGYYVEAGQTSYLTLCVANYNGSQQPGKLLDAEVDGPCHFSYAGVEMLGYDAKLTKLRTTYQLGNPAFDFAVGQDTNGQPLYACTTQIAKDNGLSLQLGKYRKDFSGCHVGWGGNEVTGNSRDYIVD